MIVNMSFYLKLGVKWLSRLYLIHETDLSEKGHRGHNYIYAKVLHGSKDNPQTAVSVHVYWSESEQKFKVSVLYGKDVVHDKEMVAK